MYKKTSLLLLVLIFFFGCTKIENDSAIFNKTAQVNNENLTKFAVSQKSVEKYIQITNAKKPDLIVKEIVPIVKGADTLLYIINFANDRGWKIVSGDKRTSPELSFSKTGYFETQNFILGISTWLEDMAGSIYSLKHSSNTDTTSVNYKLWTNIESLGKFKKANIVNQTKGGEEEDAGYWTLVFIESTDLPSNTIGPFISTKWGQYPPWNSCVPNKFNSSDSCLTGCVAVAGAQMAYYLHYKIGAPLMTYSNGSCIGWSHGDTSSNYSFSFSNLDTTSWAQMPLVNPYLYYSLGTIKVGILMGNIGYSIGMEYGYNSQAETEDLVGYFSNNGVNCTYGDYNSSIIRNNLNNQMPVILKAYATRYLHYYAGIPIGPYSYKNGHAWIANGIEDLKVHYKYYYQWFSKDNPLPEVDLLDTEHIRTEEQDLVTNSYLLMNWGYDGLWDQGRYQFSIDAIWEANENSYQYIKKMIYNFSKQ